MTYVTAGYPTVEETPDILLGMEAGGADIIELGMPFTDPIADGPTIQLSNTVCSMRLFTRHWLMSMLHKASTAEWSQHNNMFGHGTGRQEAWIEGPRSTHGLL